MKSNLAATAIIAVGLVVYGFISTGRYTLTKVSEDRALRLDRWTGSVVNCTVYDTGVLSCLAEGDTGWRELDGEPSNAQNSN